MIWTIEIFASEWIYKRYLQGYYNRHMAYYISLWLIFIYKKLFIGYS